MHGVAKDEAAERLPAEYVEAARIIKQIRTNIWKELGYSVSAGIAQNKLLAKIASAKNKPNMQTVVLPGPASAAMINDLSLRGVPGLGGKLGKRVVAWLGGRGCCSEDPTVAEISQQPIEALRADPGPKQPLF